MSQGTKTMFQYGLNFKSDLHYKYHIHRNIQILDYAFYKISVGLAIILYFTFLDIFVQEMYQSLVFRFPAIFLGFVFLLFRKTVFKKNQDYVCLAYNIFLFSLQFMMIGKILLTIDTPFIDYSIQGTVIVIALVGIEFRAKPFYSALFFISPLLMLLISSYIIRPEHGFAFIYDFSHILAISLISIVLSIAKENLQMRSFESEEKLRIEKNRSTGLYEDILKQKKEIEAKNEEIETQKEEIVAQRDFARRQRDWIVKQKDEITDSILYAKRIQDAILPSRSEFHEYFNDSFILYRPKDIVSGDFYWHTKMDDWVVFTVGDCTGHGVPGAFMSMLGMTLLDQIVRKTQTTCTKTILNLLRNDIINTLKQNDYTTTAKDGLDISICAYNTQTMQLQFSGANSTLIHVRKTSEKKEVIEIKGDKMPISFYYRMDSFTSHTIDLAKRDVIYLYTDGYPDQFGGVKGKKYKSRPFKEMLIADSEQPMNRQLSNLEKTLSSWMRCKVNNEDVYYEQNDDITVMGVRI